MGKPYISLGAILGLLGVVLGAFGRHALEGRLTEKGLGQWQTASQYQLVHAVLLVGIGVWLQTGGPKLLVQAGMYLAAGIVIFSGSLYALALTQTAILGAITPLGGAGMIAGWGLLILAARKI
jgi:uncharacterized membrane protein YgdD (TMEM256/DUF423 family)